MKTTRPALAVGSRPERPRAFGRGWTARRGLTLLALALVTVALDGCASLGCKSCGGGCKHNLFGRRRATAVAAPIEPGPPVVIDQGATGTTVAPGSTTLNGDAEDNPMLAPLNSKGGSDSTPGGSGASSSRPSGASLFNKNHATNTRASRANPRRIASGPRFLSQSRSLPTREPAARPARSNELAAADALLNDLPAPANEIGGGISPPPIPETDSKTSAKPTADRDPTANPAGEVKPTDAQSDARRTSPPSFESADPPTDPNALGAAPGIKRFKAVDLKLAGGSFPNPDGLAWLAEKGYRTVLDLRDPSEVRSADSAAVNRQALRYVALPVTESSLNVETYKKFEAELARADARPLYFFDADGVRAAALWYIRRSVADLDDDNAARKEVQDIGPITPGFLKSAQAVVAQLKAARAARGNEPKTTQAPTTTKAAERLRIVEQ